MSERLLWQGQKQEKELAAEGLKISIEGLRSSLRIALNPHMKVGEIDPKVVSQQSFELSEKVIKYKALQEEIKSINQSLGIE